MPLNTRADCQIIDHGTWLYPGLAQLAIRATESCHPALLSQADFTSLDLKADLFVKELQAEAQEFEEVVLETATNFAQAEAEALKWLRR